MSSLEMMVGEVESVKGRYVGTLFVALGGPLFPSRSMYVERVEISSHGNARTIRYHGVDLPLCPSSVLLGYLRVWLAIAAFASPFVLMWGQDVDFERPEWLVTLALVATWIFTLIVPGRLRGEAKRRVELLGDVTGVYLDPKRFDAIQRAGRRAGLGDVIARRGVSIEDPEQARISVARADRELLGSIYAFARYSAVDRPEWKVVAEEAWSRLGRA